MSPPNHFGPVSAAHIQAEFGEKSIIYVDDALGSAHRIIPQNDPHDQELDFSTSLYKIY